MRLSPADNVLTVDAATAIFDALVEHFAVREDNRREFLHHQTTSFCSEFRVGGAGRFGGKFWRNNGNQPDGTYGERWYVNAYREDVTSEVQAAIDATNAVLSDLNTIHVLR